MDDERGRGFIDGFLFPWSRIDEWFAAQSQRYVDWRAASGVVLPALLRDSVFHSLAAFGLCVLLSFLTEPPRVVGVFLLCFLLVLPGDLRQWRKHASRAAAEWSQELAAACMVEAALRKRRFLWLRIMCLFCFVGEAMAFFIRPGAMTSTDGGGFLMIFVFAVRLYLERAQPRPPGQRRQAYGKLAHQL